MATSQGTWRPSRISCPATARWRLTELLSCGAHLLGGSLGAASVGSLGAASVGSTTDSQLDSSMRVRLVQAPSIIRARNRAAQQSSRKQGKEASAGRTRDEPWLVVGAVHTAHMSVNKSCDELISAPCAKPSRQARAKTPRRRPRLMGHASSYALRRLA